MDDKIKLKEEQEAFKVYTILILFKEFVVVVVWLYL